MIVRQFRVQAKDAEDALEIAQDKLKHKCNDQITSCSTREVLPGWWEFIARCEPCD